MFDTFLAPFSSEIGIDLGTANTLVYIRGKGILVREPSVMAIHKKTKVMLAVGQEAKKMIGKNPDNILVVRPLREGAISDFEVAEKMLKVFIHKVRQVPSRFPKIFRPRVVIGIPSGITEVEKRAVKDATLRAGAREVFMIEEPLASAIGAGLSVCEPEGVLVVDIGGGTTELAVISLGGIVVGNSLRVAGDQMSEAIINYAREKYNLLLGEQTAEKVKVEVGSALETEDSGELEGLMMGRDLTTGLPKSVVAKSGEIREALAKPLSVIIGAVKDIIEATPPELLSDVLEGGITLVGGGALLRGIDRLLANETGVPVKIAEDPMSSVVRGCGKVLEDRKLLDRVRVK